MADTPLVIHEVSNRTSRVYFVDESDADRYISSFPGSVGGGMRKTRIDVVPPATPTSAARPMQGLADKLIDVARRIEGLKLECSMDPESPQAFRNGAYMSIAYAVRELASEVEAVQAQPASAPMGQRKWPFVESPGEFTKRLEWAWREFGALLPAVRYVLIESPPQFYRPPAQARMPLSEEQAEALIEASDGHWKEDVFCIGGPELMALLRAAHGISGESSGAARKDGVKGGNRG